MSGSQGHCVKEPFPECKSFPRERFLAELSPSDDQILEVAPKETRVPGHLAGQVIQVVLCETSMSFTSIRPLLVQGQGQLGPWDLFRTMERRMITVDGVIESLKLLALNYVKRI